jgi:hypothetical protein
MPVFPLFMRVRGVARKKLDTLILDTGGVGRRPARLGRGERAGGGPRRGVTPLSGDPTVEAEQAAEDPRMRVTGAN